MGLEPLPLPFWRCDFLALPDLLAEGGASSRDCSAAVALSSTDAGFGTACGSNMSLLAAAVGGQKLLNS